VTVPPAPFAAAAFGRALTSTGSSRSVGAGHAPRPAAAAHQLAAGHRDDRTLVVGDAGLAREDGQRRHDREPAASSARRVPSLRS
jgi:hypothetical protein